MKKHTKYPLWLGYMDMSLFSADPVTMVSAEGMIMNDSEGKSYIDFVSGIRNVFLGYSQDRIAKAVYEQLKTLPFSRGSSFGNDVALKCATKLAEIAPVKNARVFFHSSGSEAVEAAIKLVRQYHFAHKSKKNKILTFSTGYHGQTITALSASGEHFSKEAFTPWTDGFSFVDIPKVFEDIAVIEELFQSRDDISAVMIEPLLCNAGVLSLPEGYLSELRKLCDTYGVFLICDEISTAFGRFGKWFLSEEAEPDILLVGKVITNGYLPLSAVIVSDTVWQTFDETGFFRHGQTNINHPACCRAALETISILEELKAPELAIEKGKMLQKMLESLFISGKLISIRGKGLMYALVFNQSIHEKKASSKWLQIAMLEAGFIIGQIKNTIFISPSITVTEEQIHDFIEVLDSLLM